MSSVTQSLTSPAGDPDSELLSRIQHKRASVDKYLTKATARRRRLLNLTIITGTCAAALTTAPAFGGKSMADWLTTTFGLSAPAWQLLCLVAAVCSVIATLATQLLKSHNMDERITRGQHLRAQLEQLEIGIASRELNDAQAAKQYMAHLQDASFMQI
jgi:hypothetical protein